MSISISLGNVCNSAIWSVTNNYRPTKKDGYKTCVFDLMVSNYKGIVKCILENFKYFTNPNFLIMDNDNLIKNTYYNFIFNHESPYHADLYIKQNWIEGTNHFINNNYFHFIERYNNRIDNFKNYLNSDMCITFIIEFYYDTNPNDNCKELRDALQLKYPNLKYEIIIFDKINFS
jgi:hypothetical protein